MSWKTHGKAIMEGLGALLMALILAYREVAAEGVTMSEWVLVIIAAFGVVNVWATANITGWEKAKTFVSAAFVVLNLLVGFLTDGRLSGDETMLLVIQALSTLGVASAPASKKVVERTVVTS